MYNLANHVYLCRQVLRCLRRRPFGRNIGLCQATVNDKVSGVHEAALIASKEDNRMRLLNRLAEATAWEMHLATEALLLVITKPILQKRRAITKRQPCQPIV